MIFAGREFAVGQFGGSDLPTPSSAITGVSAASSVGTVALTGGANVSLVGVSALAGVGDAGAPPVQPVLPQMAGGAWTEFNQRINELSRLSRQPPTIKQPELEIVNGVVEARSILMRGNIARVSVRSNASVVTRRAVKRLGSRVGRVKVKGTHNLTDEELFSVLLS